MKRNLLSLIMLLTCISMMAQFDAKNSLVRKIIVEYELDNQGFYQKKTGSLVDIVDNVEATYAFVKKTGTVYAKTKNGNYQIVLNKEYAKVYKNSALAPLFDEKIVDMEVDRVTKSIEERFEKLNAARRQHLKDSLDKVRRDSLEKARQDSIALAKKMAIEQNYRNTHNWREIPMSRIGIECVDCGKQFYDNSLFSEGISNDTLYFTETVPGIMECSYEKLHAGLISPKLQKNEKFSYHCQIYKDSLYNKPYLSLGYVNAMNKEKYSKYAEEVAVKVPNGYIDVWGYDFQDGQLVFDFSYTNTSKKEIRAIDIYFNIRDAAGASKKTGKLRADGPVDIFESRQWNWTDTKIMVPGSVVDMEITRLVIIFKDGKQKILAKKDLVIRAQD
jgi:hypothetical protein